MSGTAGGPYLDLDAGRGGRRRKALPSAQQTTPARRGVEDDRNAAPDPRRAPLRFGGP